MKYQTLGNGRKDFEPEGSVLDIVILNVKAQIISTLNMQ